MAKSTQEIASLLKSVRFRRCAFGGVDEDDVWAQFGRLNEEYAELLETKRQRAEGAVSAWREYAQALEAEISKKDEMIRQLSGLSKQPESALPAIAATGGTERVSACQRGERGRDAWLQRTSPSRHACSAEQIRKQYAGKEAGPANQYG